MREFADFILPIIPACVFSGPFFLAGGILLRTPLNGPIKPKLSLFYLLTGALMITLSLAVLLIRTIEPAME
jgi:hypothetical protein